MEHRHDVNHFQCTAVGVAISCMPKESSQLKDTELGASVFPLRVLSPVRLQLCRRSAPSQKPLKLIQSAQPINPPKAQTVVQLVSGICYQDLA
ncbi:hypothetical protein NIES4073_28600 [Kalymmatonema gypsitolerans NIES-4073]|nr:hypothetical protein NIES4073_28600 [Scytonema sp. NIES-4073]